MSAEAKLPLRLGEVVADRFEVERVLGVGGMGAVFAARRRDDGERVAIKCLLPEFFTHAEVMRRFEREARATTRLRNEHVAFLYDSGKLPSGIPFIVMEYLDGRDLRSIVREQGPVSIQDAAAYVCQACVALAEAHALGIVHRDLKPANLYLTQRPNGCPLIKVLDFGIAKFQSPALAGDFAEVTRTRAVLGSRAYMSPEQMLRPREVDARADIWSLGVTLYFLVTGKNPFPAQTTEELILRIIQGTPEPLSHMLPGVLPGFEAVVMRCLSKSPEDRFGSVTELGRALAVFACAPPDRITMPLCEPCAPSMRAFSKTLSAPSDTSDTSTQPTVVLRAARGPGITVTLVGLIAALLVAGVSLSRLRKTTSDAGSAAKAVIGVAPHALSPSSVVESAKEAASSRAPQKLKDERNDELKDERKDERKDAPAPEPLTAPSASASATPLRPSVKPPAPRPRAPRKPVSEPEDTPW